jgi:hypothetical protein
MPEKPKAERLQETITILKKLQEVGIPETDQGYVDAKAKLSAWVQTGEAAKHIVTFPLVSRRGELILPKRAGVAASLLLKTVTG